MPHASGPWSPDSWQSRPVLQQPTYPDSQALEAAVRELATLPPLVTSWEIQTLKEQLAEAQQGQRFLLQGGDCAEKFAECESGQIADKLKILLQMSLILVHGTRKQVIRVGRFAGQYAKPRSQDAETRDGVSLPAYRGDLVNRVEFTEATRTPDPRNMLRGYQRAALTTNFIRSLIDGGFADLHHPEYWDLGFVEHSPHADEFRRIADSIGHSISFMEIFTKAPIGQLSRVDFFTSHEALLLPYEQAQTRTVPRRDGWYNLSTHFPWIGMRTAQPDGAHVEYARGIRNPLGIKIGTGMTGEQLLELLEVLNPADEPGRITLIHRFGAHHIAEHLPALVQAVQQAGKTVLWCCDPMHGNTEQTAGGIKTRRFEHILAELEQAFEIHRALGTYLGGVHFELTGDDVTECIGGARGLNEADLTRAYKSDVDPRLNYEQAMEMAFRIARNVAQANGHTGAS
jgi:3-deoxy-7-phosphoheptulonate synthase